MYAGLIDLPWWGYVLVTLGLTHVTIAAVTIFLHRHQAHRALDLHPLVSHFFRFWLWFTTGMVTKEWAAIHRKHHAKCETAEDPHSPQAKGLKKVFFEGAELYRAEAKNEETLRRYGHGTPDDWIERHLYSRHSALGVSILLVLNLVLFGPIGLTIWAVQMVWIPFWAAGVINGVGHYWGYRNFDCADASTNLIPWGILVGGEELHNNHHSFATSARFSTKWYEFDLGWLYLRVLSACKLATIKKVIPRPRFVAPKPVLDLDSLQAVITHRYDLLSRYAASLRRTYGEELKALRQRLGKQEAKRFAGLAGLLNVDPAKLCAERRAALETLLRESRALATLHAMRDELAQVWERTSASSDQLVKQLQDWCQRAEASGIRQLEEIALRLRRYAV
ncbi:fatty acid desaturase [Oryzomicrobium sp.]|uniref:DesA family fatty acid desaturase n=1 Tax=Oryzomicrobium sp. TaxID=1911578 RepID=UPI0025E9C803|nr:fatty acid desaturase [Oryzomicrobium sp.]MCE1243805.1 fatty acid desaturase [Oryzomicrobium sp.]